MASLPDMDSYEGKKLFVIAEVKQAVKHGCGGAAREARTLGGEIEQSFL